MPVDKITLEEPRPNGRVKRRRRALPSAGEGFRRDVRGSLTLIAPDGNAPAWHADQRVFRSLVHNRDGKIVSVGLPKFMDWDVDLATTALADEALAAGASVHATVKYDGALLIRYVDRGQVRWRTRNAHDAGSLEPAVLAVVAEQYPDLNDPELAADISLHFEFVSPRTRVVLPYPADDLILIGGVEHATLRLLDVPELAALAADHQLRAAEEVTLTETTIRDLAGRVNTWTDREGVVVRFQDGQRLLRVKADAYLLAHRRRFELNPRRVYEASRRKRYDGAAAARYLGVTPADPLHEYVLALNERAIQLERDLDGACLQLDALVTGSMKLTQKKFREQVSTPLGSPMSMAVLAWRDGDDVRARELLRTHWVKEQFGDETSEEALA